MKYQQYPKATDRPMKCDLCGGIDIETSMNVGFDIWPGGEENQHIDRCNECNAERFWCEVYIFWDEKTQSNVDESFVTVTPFEKDTFMSTTQPPK